VRGFDVPIGGAGAVVQLHVGISELRRKVLQRMGLVPPSPIPLAFLVDTGASCSWIDEMHMRSLGLDPRSWEEVHTVQSKGVPQEFPAYEVSLVLGGFSTPNTRRFELLIGGQPFINQPFDGLLGRDVLNQCRLGWRGPARNLRFEYD
jgi:hypothetical protein